MKKRLLHILPSLAPSWATTQLRLLARELPAEQFELHVAALEETRDGPEAPLADLPIYRARRRRRFDLAALSQLQRHVTELQPDMIQAWSGSAAHWAHLAARSAGAARLVVGYARAESETLWPQRLANRALVRRADRVVVHSPSVRELLAVRGWPADKIRVVAQGVEPPKSSASRGELLAELGLPDNVFLVGAAGRLRLAARLKDVIWATDMLKFIRDDVHLLIFGDGPHRARLERFRGQVRIEDKVHFLGARTDLARWLPHLNAFWSAREDAGQPLALMEAMAAGVPAIATDVPGTRELIEHGKSGFLVPVGERASLARTAHKLLEDHALAAQVGAGGQARMLAEFSPRRMADAMAAMYDEVWETSRT